MDIDLNLIPVNLSDPQPYLETWLGVKRLECRPRLCSNSGPMPKQIARVLTVSDGVAHGSRNDVSGTLAKEKLSELGFEVDLHAVVPDDAEAITSALSAWIEVSFCRLILTTGGTGLGPRDVTPESVFPLLDREIPGYGELLRRDGLQHTPTAVLSRSLAGSVNATLVLVLPGSPKAVSQGLDVLAPTIPHALDLLAGNTRHD